MFGGLFNINYTDYTGSNADLEFLYNASWLQDAAVMPRVFYYKGEWCIHITFVWVDNKFRFLIRSISEKFNNEKKAILFADMYKRTAQKDKRGELTINENDFNISYN
jgi:hypothetical protein